MREPFWKRTISSPYGERVLPGSTRRQFHLGIDYRVPQGSAVRAPLAGVVTDRRYSPANGNTVTVDHGNGWKTKYFHLLDPALVKERTKVAEGQVIGLVGETGTSAVGPHLHFETWHEGRHRDPAEFLSQIDGHK